MAYAHDIKTLLTIGKNIVIEFKRAGNGPEHDTYESICAFLNRQGGDVLLGVTDDGEVTGLPPKAAPEMVRRIVNVMNDPNLWEPRIALYPEIVVYRGKTIIRIHVPTGPDVYRFKGKCYDRVNESDVVVRGTAPIAGSGVRNLYHYVKLYSGADPIFDEEDVFRLTVPLNAEHSPEKSGGETTRKTKDYEKDYTQHYTKDA